LQGVQKGFHGEDVQNGLPTRPQAKPTPQAYPPGYVEDVGEPSKVEGRVQHPPEVRERGGTAAK
jgi:hypothetical protein